MWEQMKEWMSEI
jgi:hypothetical protein